MSPSKAFWITASLLTTVPAFFLGCSKGEKERFTIGTLQTGHISMGVNGNTFAAPSPRAGSFGQLLGRVTIDAIDISPDGVSWLPLLASSITLDLPDTLGEYLDLNVPLVQVLPDEYHAVRIKFGKGLSILENTIAPYASYPNFFDSFPRVQLFNNPSIITWGSDGVLSEIELSSRNGYLVPFRVESGKNTYLILGAYLGQLYPTEWYIRLGARATRVQPS